MIDFKRYIERQKAWSLRTFGPGYRTGGVTKHIEKEIAEVRAAPGDLDEWIDIAILAIDGAWRCGHSPADICDALERIQMRNFARTYPMPTSQEEPSEHLRK
jgi:hypothetical protein